MRTRGVSSARSFLALLPALSAACTSFDHAPPKEEPKAVLALRASGARVMQVYDPERVMAREDEQANNSAPKNASSFASTASDLSYHGGIGGIGVETAPKVYLVLWGTAWSSDPSGEAALLTNMYRGIGGSTWNGVVTQYCQGVASGTYYCNGAGQAAGNQANMYVATWSDTTSSPSSNPTQADIANEAIRAAAHFGNTTAASNASVQYVIALPHGVVPTGFGTQWCAWHNYVASSYGNLAYTNLPYMTDAGASCGANFNGLGANAGITIVAGHEFAETETDQFPSGGWVDAGGAEIGDKCAWIRGPYQGATSNQALTTGSFPMQSLWSNRAGNGVGACVFNINTNTICTPDTSVLCCPCTKGCSCAGDNTCAADGLSWSGCSGYACRPNQCP